MPKGKVVKAKHGLLKADPFSKQQSKVVKKTHETTHQQKEAIIRNKFALERLALKERQMRQSGVGTKKVQSQKGPQITLTESALPHDLTTIVRPKEMNLIDQLLEDEANVDIRHQNIQIFDTMDQQVETKRSRPTNMYEVLAESDEQVNKQPMFRLMPSLLQSVVPPRINQEGADEEDDEI